MGQDHSRLARGGGEGVGGSFPEVASLVKENGYRLELVDDRLSASWGGIGLYPDRSGGWESHMFSTMPCDPKKLSGSLGPKRETYRRGWRAGGVS